MGLSRRAADIAHNGSQGLTVLAAGLAFVAVFAHPIVAMFSALIAVLSSVVTVWIGMIRDAYSAADLGAARSEIDTERVARLKLEKQLEPRRITAEQKAAVAAALAEFQGVAYDIIWFNDDQESQTLAQDVYDALRQTTWVISPSREALGFAVVLGIQVEWAPSQAQQLSAPAIALVDALTGAGLHSQGRVNVEQERFADRIRIKVGRKPIA